MDFLLLYLLVLDLLFYLLQSARFHLFVSFPVILAMFAIDPLHLRKKGLQLFIFLRGDVPVTLLAELHEVFKLFAGLSVDR